MADSLQQMIEQFYYREAELLDHYQYEDWLGLMTDDVTYKMPVRFNKEYGGKPHANAQMYHFDEDRNTLGMRVKRLYTNFAWAEDPPSRTRRLITNVQIKENQADQTLHVNNYFILYRNRGDAANYELITGERKDRLRHVDDQWKLADRLILVDQANLGLKNLAVFF